MSQCLIKKIGQDSFPLLYGLTVESGELVFDQNLFKCCGSTGGFIDEAKNSYVACALKQRFNFTQSLFLQYQKITNQTNFESLRKLDYKRSPTLARASEKTYLRNEVCLSKKDTEGLWFKAFHLAWHFGIKIKAANFTLNEPLSLIRKVLSDGVEGEGLDVLFVPRIDALWREENAQKLEVIISFCYNNKVSFWGQFEEGQPEKGMSGGQEFGRSALFKSKINKLKSKSPLDWMPLSTRQRLMEMASKP